MPAHGTLRRSRRTRLTALAGAAGVVIALLAAAPSAGSTVPPAIYQTPPVPTSMTSWGATGPVIGTPAGTLMQDGTIRTTADPSVAVPLSAPARALLSARNPRLHGDGGGGGSTWTDATGALGGLVQSTSGSVTSVLLWRIDLGTGQLSTRSVSLSVDTYLLGAVTGAWVTTEGPASAPTVWPYDGSAPTTVTLTGLQQLLTAGPAGIVHVSTSTVDTQVHHLLSLTSADGVSTRTLADLGTADVAPGQVVVATHDDAVAWGFGGTVTYWDPSTEQSRPSMLWRSALQVTHGAVVEYSTVRTYPQTAVTAIAWRPGITGVVHLAAPLDALWPSQTPDGHPLFGASRVQTAFMDPRSARVTRWWDWSPVDGVVVEHGAPNSVPAEVTRLDGTVGHLITTYRTAVEPDDATPGNTLVQQRLLGVGASAVQWQTNQTVVLDWRYGAQADEQVSVSGPYSSTVEWTDERMDRVRIVLRRDATTTAVIGLPGVGAGVSTRTSGPFTVIALAGGARWTGPDGVLRSIAGAGAIVVDGQYVAYTSGTRTLLLDLLRPRSTTNPRVVDSSRDASPAWLSGRYLVLLRDLAGPTAHALRVVDLARGTAREIRFDQGTCTSMSGPLVLCTHDGQVETLDVSAATLELRPVWQAVVPDTAPLATFAGAQIAWAGDDDPVGGATARVAVASLPAANGTVGHPRLLGPWNRWGTVTSNASSAYCWAPEWSVSQALSSWTLTLRAPSGRVVRTWTGTAGDGALRGVRWCPGRATPGTYRWTLTGTGPTGGPVATTGAGPATGTVAVVRQVRAALTLAAPSTAAPGALRTVTSRMTRTGSVVALPRRTVTLWQRLPAETSWHLVATAVTSSTGTAAFRLRLSQTAHLQTRSAAWPGVAAATSPTRLVRIG